MLYDKDIWKVGIKDGKILIEYYGPTQEAIFTREDLVFLLKQLDDSEVCKHGNPDIYVLEDMRLRVHWLYSSCSDCGYTERVPVRRDLSVGDKEILSGDNV